MLKMVDISFPLLPIRFPSQERGTRKSMQKFHNAGRLTATATTSTGGKGADITTGGKGADIINPNPQSETPKSCNDDNLIFRCSRENLEIRHCLPPRLHHNTTPSEE
jgi:hypothetical protein